jgi:hypothetical protein
MQTFIPFPSILKKLQQPAIALVFTCLFNFTPLFGQKQLEFTSKAYHNTVYFNQGDRITYAKKGISYMRTGKIETINDSSITVNGRIVLLRDLKLIGHRKKGSMFLVGVNSFISGLMLGFALTATDDISGLISFVCAIPIITWSTYITDKNKIYKVRKKYTYAVKN